MVTRLTIDEFFEALKKRRAYPLVDTPRTREIVGKTVRALCADYPIKDRWPVLDLESAYEGYLNAQPEIVKWHEGGYNGTVRAGSFDEKYTLDEWFGDFTKQWQLKNTSEVRNAMLKALPDESSWRSPDLYKAHKEAVEATAKGFFKRLFG